MRKSLLITSALGFLAAAPSLAMANAVSAGSPACGNHFFAQIDAKALALKLEVKDKKGQTLKEKDDLPEDADTIITEINADRLAKYKKALDKVLAVSASGVTDATAALTEKVLKNNVRDNIDLARLALADTNEKVVAEFLRAGSGVDSVKPTTIADASGAGEKTLNGVGVIAGAPRNVSVNITTADLTTLVGQLSAVRDFINADATTKAFIAASSTPVTFSSLTAAQAAGGFLVSKLADGGDLTDAAVGGTDLKGVKAVLVVHENPVTLDGGVKVGAIVDANFNRASTTYVKTFVSSLVAANKSLNSLAKKLNDKILDDKRVIHTAMGGGAGATCGYFMHLGSGIAASLSIGGDYTWGKFLQVNETGTVKDADTRKLGFAGNANLTVWGVVSPSALLGLSGGVRVQQVQFGKTGATNNTQSNDTNSGNFQSFWMVAPTVGAKGRMFFTDSIYAELGVDYVIPYKKTYDKDTTAGNINKDAELRLQGIIGSFSVGMKF